MMTNSGKCLMAPVWGAVATMSQGAAMPGGRMAMKAPSAIEYTVGQPMPGTKWVVRGKLGQGGMGLVLDVVKARLIQGAMKVLLPPFAQVPEFADKFLDEVKVTARLQHPNIVQVLDFDRLADGTPFMVMERLRGRTLRAALRETRQRGKAWTAANTLAVATQIAEGLYRAHSHVPSIVHRDVKPENVFLHRAEATFESVVKVMDFGVAAVVGECDRQSIGTPKYMAPEQVARERVSPQTDQYALALVIYEMLTGRLPWDVDGRDGKALAEVRRRVAPMPPSRFCPWLPERMEAALLKALSKDPAARHDTVHGLLFELRGLQWVSDRSSAGESHSTDPMVGTLAERGLVLRDEDETFDRLEAPRPDRPTLEARELTGTSGVSVEFSEGSEGPTGVLVSGATGGVPTRPEGPSPTEAPTRRLESAAHSPADEAHASSHPLDTPMTTESAPRTSSHGAGPLRRGGLRPGAWIAIGSGAVVAMLVTAGLARSSRSAAGRRVGAAEPPAAITGPVAGPANPMPAIAEIVDAPDAARSIAAAPAPEWLGATGDPVSRSPASARPDAGGPPPPARKADGLPARPVVRSAPVKRPPPDDGRDELYVPEAR
jgi:serine/threonine-protein kinase